MLTSHIEHAEIYIQQKYFFEIYLVVYSIITQVATAQSTSCGNWSGNKVPVYIYPINWSMSYLNFLWASKFS